MKKPNLIFIFSLPRSGSTLLQRILASHSKIESASEPWLLLPLIYSITGKGIFAEYNAQLCSLAIKNLINTLPRRERDYHDAVRLFVEEIYKKITPRRCIYFLDKTPRYYLIIPEIRKIFPDSKFIFLFRHPLGVLSSIIQSFNNGSLGIYWNRIDILEGPELLANGYRQLKDESLAIQYERLITEPMRVVKTICEYLNVSYEEGMIDKFYEKELNGKLGDKVGTKIYSEITAEPLKKWKKTFNSEYRRRFAIKYVSYLGDKTLHTFGYDLNAILSELHELDTPAGIGISDICSNIDALIKSLLDIPMFKRKIKTKRWSINKYYIHY